MAHPRRKIDSYDLPEDTEETTQVSILPTPLTAKAPPPVRENRQKPMERTGDILRRARERRGDDLQQIADYLCIRKSFLVALEGSAYEEFPADTYVVGFLRSYADYLGLRGKDVVEHYRREMAGRRRKPQLVMPVPISEGKAPSALLLAGAGVAALLIYIAWYALSTSDRASVSTPPALPEIADTSSHVPAMPVATVPAAAPTTPANTTSTAAASAAPATGIAIAAPAPAPAAIPTPNATETAAPAAPATPAPTATSVTVPVTPVAHLTIRAEEASWILVTDRNGHSVYDHVMKAGEVYKVPDTPGLLLTTGNGGGVTLMLDGVELPKLSKGSAHILRDIPLSDAHLKALPGNPGE